MSGISNISAQQIAYGNNGCQETVIRSVDRSKQGGISRSILCSVRIRSLLMGVAALCAVGLTGCTTGHDLPTISGAPTPTAALEAVAKAYYDCMTDAGIEVQIDTNSDGRASIVMFTGEHDYMWRDGNGVGSVKGPPDYDPGKDPALTQMFRDYESTTGEPYELIVDGTDESAINKGCVARSGYDENAAIDALDPVDMQNLIDADNTWAQCVRENGWPDVSDVSTPTEHSDGLPSVVLPYVITEDQLRQLVEACPPADYGNSSFPTPVITFDSPAVTYDANGNPDAGGQAILDKTNALYAILWDTQRSTSGNPT